MHKGHRNVLNTVAGSLLLLSGSALASNLTIINTDSTVRDGSGNAGQGAAHAPSYHGPANTRSVTTESPGNQKNHSPQTRHKTEDSEKRSRGAPPLPTASSQAKGVNDGPSWLVPGKDGEGDKRVPVSKAPGHDDKEESAATSNTATAQKVESEKVESEKGVAISTTPKADDSAKKPDSKPEPVKKQVFAIDEGWLSDAIESLAGKAGYTTTIWAVGDSDNDYKLHSAFDLEYATAREAMSALIEPYPLKMCLFKVDHVAKVIPQNDSCQ